MKSHFRQVALIGKYQTAVSGASAGVANSGALEDIAQFLVSEGCEVVVEQATAANAGITRYPVLDVAAIGEQCDLGLVVGGDGTMLGIGPADRHQPGTPGFYHRHSP
jgi:NAD+ kinase